MNCVITQSYLRLVVDDDDSNDDLQVVKLVVKSSVIRLPNTLP